MPKKTTCQNCKQSIEPVVFQVKNLVKSVCPACGQIIWEMLVPPARPRMPGRFFKTTYGVVEI